MNFQAVKDSKKSLTIPANDVILVQQLIELSLLKGIIGSESLIGVATLQSRLNNYYDEIKHDKDTITQSIPEAIPEDKSVE